jgi:hypothetical protein
LPLGNRGKNVEYSREGIRESLASGMIQCVLPALKGLPVPSHTHTHTKLKKKKKRKEKKKTKKEGRERERNLFFSQYQKKSGRIRISRKFLFS